jgi:hypothetical protein
MKSAIDGAVEEREIEMARKAINKGFDNETIADLTGTKRTTACRNKKTNATLCGLMC